MVESWLGVSWVLAAFDSGRRYAVRTRHCENASVVPGYVSKSVKDLKYVRNLPGFAAAPVLLRTCDKAEHSAGRNDDCSISDSEMFDTIH